jgi:hypothetical protein
MRKLIVHEFDALLENDLVDDLVVGLHYSRNG